MNCASESHYLRACDWDYVNHSDQFRCRGWRGLRGRGKRATHRVRRALANLDSELVAMVDMLAVARTQIVSSSVLGSLLQPGKALVGTGYPQ